MCSHIHLYRNMLTYMKTLTNSLTHIQTRLQTHPCSHIPLHINKLTYTHTVTHSLIHDHTNTLTHNSLPHNTLKHTNMLKYTHVHTDTFTCTWIHAQIYSGMWTCSHTLMHTAHAFIHTKTHIRSHMDTFTWTHTNMLMHTTNLVLGLISLKFFIKKTFRKRVLHCLIFFFILAWLFLFSILWARPYSKCLGCINYEISAIIIPILLMRKLSSERLGSLFKVT